MVKQNKYPFLFKPISPYTITQTFGENRACIDKATGKITITCDGLNPPLGYRSIYSRMLGHNGIDMKAIRNTPIYSSQDGEVVEIVDEKVRGLGIGIITDNKFWCTETQSFEHFKIRYWHNLVNLVRKGDKVSIGQHIANVDNTGYSSGDHLHFEIKPVKITKRNKDGTIKSYENILQNNGYFGAINPLPYLREENASRLQGIRSVWERILWAISI
jgi:murein DD-endopeptidase MepM/ murein hydrolase activator NlpD